jgi:hypothetical protein
MAAGTWDINKARAVVDQLNDDFDATTCTPGAPMQKGVTAE